MLLRQIKELVAEIGASGNVSVWCFLQEFGYTVNLLGACPSVDTLRTELADASQLWLISTSSAILSTAHIDFIVDEWRKGLALYVFGDNAPFYVDANILLKVEASCPIFVVTHVLCAHVWIGLDWIGGALTLFLLSRRSVFHKCRGTTVPAST